jgi:hypothetical protein
VLALEKPLLSLLAVLLNETAQQLLEAELRYLGSSLLGTWWWFPIKVTASSTSVEWLSLEGSHRSLVFGLLTTSSLVLDTLFES